MRIAFLTPEFVTEPYFAGGLSQYLGRVVPALAERGHQVEVFVASPQESNFPYRDAHVWRSPQKRILSLRAANGFRRLVGRPRWAWTQRICTLAKGLDCSLRRRSRTDRFDIVQAASWMACGYFSVRRPVAPVVVRVSSFSPMWDVITYGRVTADQRKGWRLELNAMRRAAGVYAPSRFLADHISRETGLHVDVIRPPFSLLPLPEDPSVAQSVAALSPYLLFFGRLSRFKGVALLAEAAQALLREVPDFRLVVAGPDGDSENLLLDLQRAFPDRVRCLGVLPPEKLRPLIKDARAVVLPSLMDNLPNACLEAMSLGQVVIGPDGVSFDELLADGDSGVLFRLGDVASLQRAIVRVWSMSEEARTHMGQKARSHIAATLAPHQTSQELESFYEEVIRRHARAGCT